MGNSPANYRAGGAPCEPSSRHAILGLVGIGLGNKLEQNGMEPFIVAYVVEHCLDRHHKPADAGGGLAMKQLGQDRDRLPERVDFI